MNSEELIIIVIVGALVLALFSAVLIVGLGYWWFKKEQSRKQNTTSTPQNIEKPMSTVENTTNDTSNKEDFSAFAPKKEAPVVGNNFPLHTPPPPQQFSADELIDMEPPPLSDPNTEDGIYNEQESPTEENLENSNTTTINEGEEETLGENDATVLMMRPPPKGIKIKKPIVKK